MAFLVSQLNGVSFSASDINFLSPDSVTVLADGNYQITSQTGKSLEDFNSGLPGALLPTDIGGFTFTAYSQRASSLSLNSGFLPNPVVTYQLDDYTGVPGGTVQGAVVLASSPYGYLVNQIVGFNPKGAPNTYVGLFDTLGYYLLTNNISTDTYNSVSTNFDAVSDFAKLLPTVFTAVNPVVKAVPLPGMGLTIGCLVLALVVVRALSGRGFGSASAA